MDTLFHLVSAFIGGMAVGIHKKHSLRILAILSFSAALIDIDHFIIQGIFHNLLITLVLPSSLFLLTFYYERGSESIKWQSYSLILLVMLMGHLLADLFYGDFVRFFYPFSQAQTIFPSQIFSTSFGTIISGDGIALLICGGIILLAHFTEDFIYFFERQQNSLVSSIKNVFKQV